MLTIADIQSYDSDKAVDLLFEMGIDKFEALIADLRAQLQHITHEGTRQNWIDRLKEFEWAAEIYRNNESGALGSIPNTTYQHISNLIGKRFNKQ